MSGGGRTTGAEIETWLSTAEATLAATARQRGRLTVVSSLLYLLTAGVVAVAVAVAVRVPHATGVAIATVAAAGALGGLLTGLARAAARRRAVEREEQDMVVIVNRIREVLPLVATREEWVSSQEQAVRTRLAKFPITVGQGRNR